MKKCYCDRCGEKIERSFPAQLHKEAGSRKEYDLVDDIANFLSDNWDLCQDCYDVLSPELSAPLKCLIDKETKEEK